MVVVYFGLGSNSRDRFANIQNAIRLMNDNNITVKKISPIYETEPVGKLSIFAIPCPFPQKPSKFLNCVIETETAYEPFQLLSIIHSVEKSLGRKRIKWIRNAPRTIDIDILFYADKIINKPMLKIPHPEIEHRAFVLVPLFDIAPDFIHPILNRTIRDLTKNVDKKGVSVWQTKITA